MYVTTDRNNSGSSGRYLLLLLQFCYITLGVIICSDSVDSVGTSSNFIHSFADSNSKISISEKSIFDSRVLEISNIMEICPSVLPLSFNSSAIFDVDPFSNCYSVCFSSDLFYRGVLSVNEKDQWCCCSDGSNHDINFFNVPDYHNDVHKSYVVNNVEQFGIIRSFSRFAITIFFLLTSAKNNIELRKPWLLFLGYLFCVISNNIVSASDLNVDESCPFNIAIRYPYMQAFTRTTFEFCNKTCYEYYSTHTHSLTSISDGVKCCCTTVEHQKKNQMEFEVHISSSGHLKITWWLLVMSIVLINTKFRFALPLLMMGLLVITSPTANAQCNAIPISLGNITSCVGSVCYLTQNANVAIPNIAGSSVCLMFVSPDGISPVQYVNLTLDSSNFVFSPDYSYYFDDPVVSPLSKCNCPPKSTLQLSSCVNALVGSPYWNISGQTGIAGNNPGPKCASSIVGVSASDCTVFGFSLLKRFKAVHMPQNPSKNFQLSVSYNSSINGSAVWQAWSMNYIGLPTYSIGFNNNLNITIVSDTSSYNTFWEFVVFDIQDPSDYYLLTASDVNSLDTYDPQRMGFIRLDDFGRALFDPTLNTKIGKTVIDCPGNVIKYAFPWHSCIDLLDQRKRYLSESLWPQSMYIDPDYYFGVPYSFKEEPKHQVNPWFFLKNGWLIQATSITFVGITQENFLTPSPTSFNALVTTGAYYQNVSYVCLDGTGGFVNLTGMTINYSTFTFYSISSANTELVQFMSWPAANNNTCMGICVYPGVSITTPNANEGGCIYVNFTAISWPSLQPTTFTFNNTGFSQVQIGSKPPLSSIQLLGPVNSGVTNVQLQFKNLEIQFSNSLIQPKITNFGSDQMSGLWIVAQSVTVGGTCYVSTNPPGIIITQGIVLGVSPSNFTYNFNQAQFTGYSGVIIQCAAQIATVNVQLNYNLSPNSSDFENGTNLNPGGSGFDWGFPGNWFDFKLPGLQLPDSFWNRFTDWILIIAYYLGIILVSLLAFWIVFKIMVFIKMRRLVMYIPNKIKSMFWKKKPYQISTNNIQEPEERTTILRPNRIIRRNNFGMSDYS